MRRIALTMAALLALSCSDDDATRDSPPVQVTDPAAGMGKPFTSSFIALAPLGYREREFFFASEAVNYSPQGELTEDGKWVLREGSKLPFASRLLVRRPEDAGKFNGTVIIEWLNVSGGADADPGFLFNWEEITREGYAWVGVSAQKTGIDGGGGLLSAPGAIGLKQYDAVRYGALVHPGDSYSYDIYTRAAQVVRGAGNLDVLEGLKPARVIAYGESQSAARMVAYIDGVQPLTKAFDGFFVHSRSTAGAGFGDEIMVPLGGSPQHIRDDLKQPVFQFQTETDVLGLFGFARARQPDSDRLRTWEVAGTAHADKHLLSSTGQAGFVIDCPNVNDGPQHFVIKAALHALDVWLKDGTPPPKADLLSDGAKDENGNTRGGVRTPAVDVPIAMLSGTADLNGDILCSLFGKTTPFRKDKLMQLYPSHADYVAKVTASAAKAQAAGFLLPPEQQTMVGEANAAAVP